jgi:plastocyanin
MPLLPARKIGERLRRNSCLLTLFLSAGTAQVTSALAPVTAEVEIVTPTTKNQGKGAGIVADASEVVIWLIPLDRAAQAPATVEPPGPTPQLVQHNKSFQPHILVVEVGTIVQSPNKDPFFHNIFSLFEGKRFDLGLYESGSSRTVRFDRAGVSYLFCNIHAEMSAVIVVVDTPYFGISDHSGHLMIHNVPSGRYEMHVWYERSLPENLKNLNRQVVIAESTRSLGPIRVVDNANSTAAHKNKYGQDYVPPPRPNYVRP